MNIQFDKRWKTFRQVEKKAALWRRTLQQVGIQERFERDYLMIPTSGVKPYRVLALDGDEPTYIDEFGNLTHIRINALELATYAQAQIVRVWAAKRHRRAFTIGCVRE
jgi:hypothetical protein